VTLVAPATDLRVSLVEALTTAGVLVDPAWRAAFTEVPREIFVPRWFVPRQGKPGWRLVENSQEWLDGVYADAALVTQLDGDDRAVDLARRGEYPQAMTPTSSSSAPTLMASMLESLAVEPDLRVMEIGTGTGYNAALLAHRLGAGNVTSVEVDPNLAEQARRRLAEIGYEDVVVVTGDGTNGWSTGRCYDRIIATVALSRVPPAWLAQGATGAVIVVPLRFAGHAGLMVRLVRDSEGGASGRFLTQYGGFMSTRDTIGTGPLVIRQDLLADAEPSETPPQALTGDHPAAFYLSMTSPCPYTVTGFIGDEPGAQQQTWGHGMDGSSFVVTTDNGITKAAANGPLWEQLDAAYRRWRELGEPTRDRFGFTVAPGGKQQVIWLDNPSDPISTL
jgi:protein-L-isoaspartate(D-aspartate) O-methyltransferase